VLYLWLMPKQINHQNDWYKFDSGTESEKYRLSGATPHSREVVKKRVQNCILLVFSLRIFVYLIVYFVPIL
jgi:hypothetical protein